MKTGRATHESNAATNAAHVGVQRGTLIALKSGLNDSSTLAIVVSNDQQNEMSDYIIVVPLERRVSRLRAPFAVDLGRNEGLRELHTARCDWVTTIQQSEVKSIERAKVSAAVLAKLEVALRAALGFHVIS